VSLLDGFPGPVNPGSLRGSSRVSKKRVALLSGLALWLLIWVYPVWRVYGVPPALRTSRGQSQRPAMISSWTGADTLLGAKLPVGALKSVNGVDVHLEDPEGARLVVVVGSCTNCESAVLSQWEGLSVSLAVLMVVLTSDSLDNVAVLLKDSPTSKTVYVAGVTQGVFRSLHADPPPRAFLLDSDGRVVWIQSAEFSVRDSILQAGQVARGLNRATP